MDSGRGTRLAHFGRWRRAIEDLLLLCVLCGAVIYMKLRRGMTTRRGIELTIEDLDEIRDELLTDGFERNYGPPRKSRFAEKWLKFRARLAEYMKKPRAVPDRNGIVQMFTNLEMKMQSGRLHGGARAMFITALAKMEDKLTTAQETIATMRREEEMRRQPHRREAVEATRRKLSMQDE